MNKSIVVLVCFVGLCCGNVVPDLNRIIDNADTIYNEKIVEGVIVNERQGKGLKFSSINELWSCGAELKCWVDKAEKFIEHKRTQLLADADAQFRARSLMTGRKSDDTPSALADTVQKLIGEISEAIRTSLVGFFKDYQGDFKIENPVQDVQDVVGEEDDDDDEEESRGLNGEARKKKKKKLKSIIKLLVLGAVLKAKLTVLLQLLSAALQIKFFLIALAGLILNAARLWIDLKKGHHPQKVIYYEHAQHQHHYDHLDDDHGGWWGRAYDEEDANNNKNTPYRREAEQYPYYDKPDYAQDLAYKAQKPYAL